MWCLIFFRNCFISFSFDLSSQRWCWIVKYQTSVTSNVTKPARRWRPDCGAESERISQQWKAQWWGKNKKFYSWVRKYFVTSCNYIVTKFPLQDDVLKHARVANPANRVPMTYSTVDYFINRFGLDGIRQRCSWVRICIIPSRHLRWSNPGWESRCGVDSDLQHGEQIKKYLNLSRVMLTILSLGICIADWTKMATTMDTPLGRYRRETAAIWSKGQPWQDLKG